MPSLARWCSLAAKLLMFVRCGTVADRGEDQAQAHAIAAYKRHVRLREEFLRRRYNGSYDTVVPWDHRSHVYVWDWFPPVFSCPWRDRLGRFGDGGKVVCNWQALARKGQACTVVSIGVQKEVTFETELASRTQCQIHAFDHTVPKLPTASTVQQTVVRPCDGTGRGGALSFRKLGLGATPHQQGDASKLRTLDELTADLGRIDLLKIDCESCEWAVFRQLQRAGSLARVDQLLIELHLSDRRGSGLGIKEVADLFGACEEAGLYPFSWEPNWRPSAVMNQKPWAIEYSFVRANSDAMRTPPYNYVSDPTATCEADSDPCEARAECRQPPKVGRKLAHDSGPTGAVADEEKKVRAPPAPRIPKIVWQTYKNCNLSAAASDLREAMIQDNPNYTFHLYDDAAAEAFIRFHFVPFVADAFVSLRSGLARADLWRYCVLFVHGGVYLDVDAKLKRPFDSFLRPDDAAFLSLEAAWWPGDDSKEMLLPLLNVKPEDRDSIPGQSAADRRRHGLPMFKFAQFMLAFEPGHALLHAMILETARAVHRWEDTPATNKLKMRSRLLWLTGPSAFTLVIHRMAAAGQLQFDRSGMRPNQTLSPNPNLELKVPPGSPQAIRLAKKVDYHDEVLSRKYVPAYAAGVAKGSYWRQTGPMKTNYRQMQPPTTPPGPGASLLLTPAAQESAKMGCTPVGSAAGKGKWTGAAKGLEKTVSPTETMGEGPMAATMISTIAAVRTSASSRVFSRIYDRNTWGTGGGSGKGSTLVAAQGASKIIFDFVVRNNISSMVDAPCGAMEWQKPLIARLQRHRPSFQYTGVDVVDSVVVRNQQSFSGVPGVQFATVDLTSGHSQLPSGVGLILSRDALQHNTHADAWRMLATYVRANARYLLVGSYPAHSLNHKVRTGQFFRINLAAPPFALQPAATFSENSDGKSLYLYRVDELRDLLHRRGHGNQLDHNGSFITGELNQSLAA